MPRPPSNTWIHRCATWDYHDPSFYMITLTTAERKPLLGMPAGGVENPHIVKAPLGEAVEKNWKNIPHFFPQIDTQSCSVMPDHFHGILRVKQRLPKPRLPKPLGQVIRGFKAGTTKTMLELASAGLCSVGGHSCPTPSLWSEGFQDTLLSHRGQLAHMKAYILDNPRRLAIKRAHPDLFRIVRDLYICKTPFAAIGNHFLLDAPVKIQIQCSRRISPLDLETQTQATLAATQHGAIVVSPCISPGEKQMARAVLDAKAPLIVLLENGFPPLYKPPKTYFDACAAGRLLMLAPWPYNPRRHTITRNQCLQLNTWAQLICKERPVAAHSCAAPLPM